MSLVRVPLHGVPFHFFPHFVPCSRSGLVILGEKLGTLPLTTPAWSLSSPLLPPPSRLVLRTTSMYMIVYVYFVLNHMTVANTFCILGPRVSISIATYIIIYDLFI